MLILLLAEVLAQKLRTFQKTPNVNEFMSLQISLRPWGRFTEIEANLFPQTDGRERPSALLGCQHLKVWTRFNLDPHCHPLAILVFQAKLPSLSSCCPEPHISSIWLGVWWIPSPHKLWTLRSQTLSSSSCCMKLWTSLQIPRLTPPTSQHQRDEFSRQHKPSLDREIMNGWTDACSSLIPLTYAGQ